jgi:5-methylcytosine-specific restriction enzyme A
VVRVRAKKVCSTPRCPNLVESGRCDDCKGKAEQRRGTAAQRGYTSAGHRRFRRAVLRRDPLCVLCSAPSTVADHWPRSRRELVEQGLNPNDPAAGRGLCASCHGRETAANPDQRGGWAAR